MKELFPPEAMEEAVFADEKQTRDANIRVIKDKLAEAFADKEEWLPLIDDAVYQYQKNDCTFDSLSLHLTAHFICIIDCVMELV